MFPNLTHQDNAGNAKPAPTIDRGFFALDRNAQRAAYRRLGPTLAGVLIALASEVRHDGERLTLPTGNASDIAELIGASKRNTCRYLAALEEAGDIEWTRATNHHTGRLVLTLELERPKRSRKRAEAPAIEQPSAPVAVPESDAPPPVDNIAPTDAVRDSYCDRSVPLNDEIHISITSNPPQSPPTPSNGEASPPSSRVGEETRDEAERRTSDIVAKAAEWVCKRREDEGRGKAGPGAQRKVRDGIIAAGLDRKALEWINAGHDDRRVASAIGDRYRASKGEQGNANAIPFDRGELEERQRAAAEACYVCDGGWITHEIMQPYGLPAFYSAPCACQSLEAITGVSS